MNKYEDHVAVFSEDIDPKEDDALIKAYIKQVNTQWVFARGKDNVLQKYQVTATISQSSSAD